jgi:hypothetical protein
MLLQTFRHTRLGVTLYENARLTLIYSPFSILYFIFLIAIVDNLLPKLQAGYARDFSLADEAF